MGQPRSLENWEDTRARQTRKRRERSMHLPSFANTQERRSNEVRAQNTLELFNPLNIEEPTCSLPAV